MEHRAESTVNCHSRRCRDGLVYTHNIDKAIMAYIHTCHRFTFRRITSYGRKHTTKKNLPIFSALPGTNPLVAPTASRVNRKVPRLAISYIEARPVPFVSSQFNHIVDDSVKRTSFQYWRRSEQETKSNQSPTLALSLETRRIDDDFCRKAPCQVPTMMTIRILN